MPSVQAPATILVTGATGYVGAHVVKDLVLRGFRVRAAVRAPASGEYLKNIAPGRESQVTYTLVKDISDDNAFDEAVKGVDAVIHLATPVNAFMSSDVNPQDVIGPAIAGTVGILQSAQRHGSSVKRVIVCSSGSTIGFPRDVQEDQYFDETQWNDFAVEAVQNKTNLPGDLVYVASKTLAEKAALQFPKDNAGVKFDVVALLPAYIFGPAIHDVPSKDKLSVSQVMFAGLIKEEKTTEERVKITGPFVDVRDTATLHSLALGNENVSGERISLHSGNFSTQLIYDALNSTTRGSAFPNVPVGIPGSTITAPHIEYSNKKALTIFSDFKFRDLEETTKDMAEQLSSAGWLV